MLRTLRRGRHAEAIEKAVRRAEPDMVHLMNSGLSPFIAGLGCKCVITVHGKDFFRPWLCGTEEMRAGIRQANAVIAVSGLTRRRLLKEGVRATVIHHGINPGKFTSRVKGGCRILTVARVSPNKNIETVIGAVARLLAENPGIVYDVVGPVADPRYARFLHELTERHGLTRQVRFLGAVPERHLAACYEASDVFVLVSRELPGDFEGFGISALEAMARGLPVVISRGSGMEEFIGRGGIAVPPEDVRRLATALLAILSDSEKRRKMGAAARRIAERFTWESCVERTEKVYLKALATGTRR